jgi:hypothetical protein
MSDTPETDAFSVKFKSVCGSKAWVPTDICRRFERERNKVLIDRANGEIATMTINHYERILNERDEAQNMVEKLTEQGLRLMDDNRMLKREIKKLKKKHE